jgi:hypothetical protein
MPKSTGRTDNPMAALDYGTFVDSKGYLTISAGPLRGTRVHRLIAEAKLGRALRRDEVVHHINGNKLDCSPGNLDVMNERDHNAVSAKQAWYLKNYVEPREKKDWDAYFDSANA